MSDPRLRRWDHYVRDDIPALVQLLRELLEEAEAQD